MFRSKPHTQTHNSVLLVARNGNDVRYLVEYARTLYRDGRIYISLTSPDRPLKGLHDLLSDRDQIQVQALDFKQAVSRNWHLILLCHHEHSARFLPKIPKVFIQAGLGAGELTGRGSVYDRSLISDDAGKALYSCVFVPSQAAYERMAPGDDVFRSVARVVGDPVADRLVVSNSLREQYREKVGVFGSQRVVLLSSTWSRGSLWELGIGRLLAEACQLPEDYVPLLRLHPRLWETTSGGYIENIVAPYEGRVRLLPPGSDWIPQLVAADVTIGDFGSLALYTSFLGRPFLKFPTEATYCPESPASTYLREFNTLSLEFSKYPLVTQIASATGSFDSRQFADLEEIATFRGISRRLIRPYLYKAMRLPEPAGELPEVEPVPVEAAEF